MQLPLLSFDSLEFPPIESALDDPNGLLAFGGDLSVPRLLAAYRRGIFPWFNQDEPILWWSPSPRSVLYPDAIHISKSTRKAIRQSDWQVSVNNAFGQVIRACAQTRQMSGTWICDSMITAYNELHKAGYAHSFEVWQQQQLVGGLYGVQIGQVFFGESMFSRQSNASKVAMLLLKRCAQTHGLKLIDCQLQSEHLDSLGASTISRASFKRQLQQYCALSTTTTWHLDRMCARGLLQS